MSNFEFQIAEAQDQERVVRVNVAAALAGATTAAAGYFYLARKGSLPDVLTEEVLGDVSESPEGLIIRQQIKVGKNGEAITGEVTLIPTASEQQHNSFVMSLDTGDLTQTADQLHKNITDYLVQHPVKPESKTRIELEIIDQTYGVDPLQQLTFLSEAKPASSTERNEDGLYFEGFYYQSGEQTNYQELLQTGENLQKLLQSKLTTETVDVIEEGEKVTPFTALQYEKLAQLAQEHGYGTVEDFISAYYYDASKTKDQIDDVFHEIGILKDQPSVVVRIIEQFPRQEAFTIEGCRLQTYTVEEQYHHKEYDPAAVPLGIVSVLGIVAGGIRYSQRRKVLNNEKLRKLGLDGPAPSKETFEAVKNGAGDTRQKLMVLKYQKAAELAGEGNKRVNNKRLLATSCGIALSGLISAFGISVVGGEKPDERPIEKPLIHIVGDSNDNCSSSDMVSISYEKDLDEEQKYFVDQP